MHSIPLSLNDGTETDFGRFAGKAVLVVNVASACGFTRQYDGLEALYTRFKDRGFEILGVPCNQFGGQEPGTDEEIGEFCRRNFGVTFPLTAKTDVNGADRHPLYAALAGAGEPIEWNFEKFLVGPDGAVLVRFASKVEPEAAELATAIESALA
ncbi:glutathione peroxidase [Pseudarthrobacter sp. P1]|uniref:glutathione peroxidase n=1 Tax=Pseudarthrobacter sp. P1 TaxID=3418418 RepID=UPI003CECDE3E